MALKLVKGSKEGSCQGCFYWSNKTVNTMCSATNPTGCSMEEIWVEDNEKATHLPSSPEGKFSTKQASLVTPTPASHPLGEWHSASGIDKMLVGSFEVNETQVKEIEVKISPPKQGRFVLLAEKGIKPPKFVHSNLDSAINEAHRLAVITQGNVKILEVIGDVSYNVHIDAIFEKKDWH